MGLISVMMPVYNAEMYLKESIESILNQTETNFELVIINDGSTDSSEDIILSYRDPRIVYSRQENGGEASARNAALERLKGEYVVFQDADDISIPSRLETLKKAFVSESIGFVHSDMLFINQHGEAIGYFQGRNVLKDMALREYLKLGNPYHNGSMMIRSDLLKKYRYVKMKVGTDTDMGKNFATNWDSVHIPQPLLFYRRHENNVSTKPLDDAIWFRPVKGLLDNYPIKELVPEINWNVGIHQDNVAKAKAIISLILHRRDFIKEAASQMVEAESLAVSRSTKHLCTAFRSIFDGHYQEARDLFESIESKDHIVHNYLGETCFLLGQRQDAFYHFLEANNIDPYYSEALDNIKGVGGAIDFHLMDPPYYKAFHQHLKNSKATLGIPRISGKSKSFAHTV